MSQIFTKNFEIECPPEKRSWREIGKRIGELPLPGVPIRVILTSVRDELLTFNSA